MCEDPVLKKEREWLQMAEDQKQQLQRPQDFFPKEEEEEGECGCKTNPNTALFDVLATI